MRSSLQIIDSLSYISKRFLSSAQIVKPGSQIGVDISYRRLHHFSSERKSTAQWYETSTPKSAYRALKLYLIAWMRRTRISKMAPVDNESPKQARVTFRDVEEFRDSSVDPIENYLDESIPMSLRPRSMSHHLSSTKVPSRTWLIIQARWWRTLMGLGMRFHDWAPPRPPKPAYTRKIPTEDKPIELCFYLPTDYYQILNTDPSHRFPVVMNFHGGGFCLGDARDDRYWARVVMKETSAVFISVNYRRAPEAPFPKPVDDCVEALLYISAHAPDLHIDPLNVALSGFSAGANLAFSVPLRLRYYKKINALQEPSTDTPLIKHTSPPPTNEDGAADTDADEDTDSSPTQDPNLLSTRDFAHTSRPTYNRSTSTLLRLRTGTPLQIRTIIAWYPLLDWTQSRSQKKRESRNPKKCLPKTFTDLFDFSYLPPPDKEGTHCSPYASPGLAPDHMLSDGLPQDVQMWLCEWDMLLREGQVFASRLEKLGKNIESKVVPRVPHGWDKSPNPFRDQAAIDELYTKAARGVNEVFESDDGLHTRASSINEGLVGRQPRRMSLLPM